MLRYAGDRYFRGPKGPPLAMYYHRITVEIIISYQV